MSSDFIDLSKTSDKYIESSKRLGRKLVEGYEDLDIFLNDICYNSEPYIEEGGSNLTSDDYQCKFTFDGYLGKE